MEDYYENNLLPKMLSFPHQYLNMIAQTKQRKNKENEKPDRAEGLQMKSTQARLLEQGSSPQKGNSEARRKSIGKNESINSQG